MQYYKDINSGKMSRLYNQQFAQNSILTLLFLLEWESWNAQNELILAKY